MSVASPILARPVADTVLGHRSVYILPTRAGLLFAFALLTMLLGAINYNNSLGYMLTFWLGSLALVSIVHCYRNLAGLRVVPGRVRAVFCGELAGFELTLVNDAQLARRGVLLCFESVADTAARGPAVDAAADAGAPARTAPDVELMRIQVPVADRTSVHLPVRTVARGWHPLGRVVVATRYPFGLFRAWSNVDTGLACLVYPRPAGEAPLPAADAGERDGGVCGGPGGEDYAGLRPYRPGDPLRHVHWKVAARSVELPVKEFEGAPGTDLMLDFSALTGSTEMRLSQLTLWVLEAEAAGRRYGLGLPGTVLSPGRGDAHLHRCLTHLALHDTPRPRP